MIYLTSVNYEEKLPASKLDDCLARIACRDTDALADLYRMVSDRVYGFALSIVKNPEDARDVLHDLFTVVYESAGSYNSQGKPLAWLLTVTRNLCLQQLRDRKRTMQLPEPMGEDQTADQTADHAEQTENKMLVAEWMSLLSEEEGQILVLHAVSGLKHREIAETLGLSLSTVLSKYHRSIKKIRHYSEGRY